MRRLALSLAALAILAAPAGAAAAQRYAAPAGSGEVCGQASPCSLEVAIEKAQANDEVIVTGGTYEIAGTVAPSPGANNLYVHGDFAGPTPVVSGSNFGALISGYTAGSRISYLDLRNTGEFGGGLACGAKATVERVRVSVTGNFSVALGSAEDCAVHDSLLLASGENSAALASVGIFGASTGVVRNVTAIAAGPESVGIRASYNNPGPGSGSFTLDLKNSIASGQGVDLLALYGLEGPGNIAVANSNFDTQKEVGGAKVIDAGGNQKAPPLFVNAAGGDYREAAGSPTIDAGVADQIGSLDLAGAPRLQGPAPDIGAYEFPAPPTPRNPQIESLSLSPKRFRAANFGEAVISRKKKPKAPVTTTVAFGLTEAGTVAFSVQRAVHGRKVGRKCRPAAKANRSHKKCTFFKPLRGGFPVAGAKGANSFTFSGRLGGKPLKPGGYRLLGSAGATTKSARFTIVK